MEPASQNGTREPFGHWPIRPRVLIIDDDEAARFLMRHRWEQAHGDAYDIVEAEDVEPGHNPDAIVLDMNLASTSGAATEAKARATYPGTPIQKVSTLPQDSETLRKDDAAEIVDRVVAKLAQVVPPAPPAPPPQGAPAVSWHLLAGVGAALCTALIAGGTAIIWLVSSFPSAAAFDEHLSEFRSHSQEQRELQEVARQEARDSEERQRQRDEATRRLVQDIAVRLGVPERNEAERTRGQR